MRRKKINAITCILCCLLCSLLLFYPGISGSTLKAAGGNLKGADFSVSCEALEKAMSLDIESYSKKEHIDWIDALAYIAAKYEGDFRRYREADLDHFARLRSRGMTTGSITRAMKDFPHYQKVYRAVLNGMLGRYKTEVSDKTGTRWVERYGLKAFSPLAAGFSYTHFDDFGEKRSYGYSLRHLGHDLNAAAGTPVTAVEGGIVETLGWDQYGGWRIGIRSFDRFRCYYYDHLQKDHPYAEHLHAGQTVTAGQVIGYVGQTGYSLKENTDNMDTPRLHYGMQILADKKTGSSLSKTWIDLYAITQLLENHRAAVMQDGIEYVRKYHFSEENYNLASARETRRESVKLPILMYHGLLKDPAMQNSYVISPNLFEQDLLYLKKQGYTTILISDLIAFVEDGVSLPEKPVLLTFDDGYYNNYYYGFPLLQKYKMKAVISIIGKETDRYSRLNEDHATYSNLTWKQAAEMVKSGLVEIQNHTYASHGNTGGRKGTMKLPGESEAEYARYFEKDLMTLQKKIKDAVGTVPAAFTYPFGAVSESSLKLVKELGFKASLGCEEGINLIQKGDPDSLFQLKRYLRTPEKSAPDFFQKIQKDMEDCK